MRMLTRLTLAALLAASPMLAMAEEEVTGDPDVTIRQDGDKTITEYRQNGFLYAIKVTPKNGKPYFLVRADGSEGNFIRSDQPDMLIPAWEIFSW
ncbi:DUF2782 domain-containing protein [Pseudomonas sp. ML96]|uniref:DUF2782 domain-containing protein n=1 Tax=Pseudomonas sp. ML96 TaxID=1523503 RepID=UPI0005BA492D|nr:DUF2782 domain-containing protein [Pseudomonas sp. ML96]